MPLPCRPVAARAGWVDRANQILVRVFVGLQAGWATWMCYIGMCWVLWRNGMGLGCRFGCWREDVGAANRMSQQGRRGLILLVCSCFLIACVAREAHLYDPKLVALRHTWVPKVPNKTYGPNVQLHGPKTFDNPGVTIIIRKKHMVALALAACMMPLRGSSPDQTDVYSKRMATSIPFGIRVG